MKTKNFPNYIYPLIRALFIGSVTLIQSCKPETPNSTDFSTEAIQRVFGSNINILQPENYANQSKPNYILLDNSGNNPIEDKKATLGRVLFYDKKLSYNETVSCASCHKQEYGFSDIEIQSKGVNGNTNRHAMRLINTRFSRETRFFWDERAASLEIQTTMPIQDHAEMGYSGLNGDPGINDLLNKLNNTDYYKELIAWAYNDKTGKTQLSEVKMQECLSQFIRSIQSFDSKYDQGRGQLPINANNNDLPNFTSQENNGRRLFTNPPVFGDSGKRIAGGMGCAGCHRPPEFDIDPNSLNNGIVGNLINPGTLDLTNTRSPSLRDLVNQNGEINGPMMHTGSAATLENVLGHYNNINVRAGNTAIDPRLTPGGFPQRLNMTPQERSDLVAFLKTLSGSAVYTDKKWSNPFQ